MSTRILRVYVRILRVAFGHPIGNPDTPGICPDIPDIKFLFERIFFLFYRVPAFGTRQRCSFTVCLAQAHGKVGRRRPAVRVGGGRHTW